MNDLFRTLESGDKTIDGVIEGRSYPEDVRPSAWPERTEHRNNEIPSAPPYKAKIYNLNSLTSEEFRQFLTDAGISVLHLEEHNGYFVEVETPDDLAFIVSLDGEYYDEEHGEDDPPIKVRVFYNDSRHAYQTSLVEFTRDILQGVGAGGATSTESMSLSQIRGDNRNAATSFNLSRDKMGTGLDKKSSGGALLSRTEFSTQLGSANPQPFNSKASTSATESHADLTAMRAPAVVGAHSSVTATTNLNFRDKKKDAGAPTGLRLADMRKGVDTNFSFRSAQQQVQDRPVIARKPYLKKVVDADGWISNA